MSKIEHSKPSLRVLGFILRNRELWPDGFEWEYRDCSKCAMGMARKLWPSRIASPSPGDVSYAFKLGEGVAFDLFTGSQGSTYNNISPETVADRIDRYLEKSGA